MGVFSGPADFWTDGTDDGRIHIATKGVVQDGLVLNLDAGASTSYPGSGTTWTDLSSNENNGTITNGPTYSSADGGGSFTFDGVNDYAEVTGSNADFLVGSQDFTIEWWEYFTGGISYQGHLGVFEIVVGAAPIQIWTASGGFQTYAGGWESLGVSPTSNQWSHYAISGVSGNFNIYKNGSYVTNSSVNWSLSSSTVKFAVGGTPGWAFGNYAMSGKISAVRVYKGKALTAAEIQQNYNALRGRFGI